jgi:hypothetical protein
MLSIIVRVLPLCGMTHVLQTVRAFVVISLGGPVMN